MNPKQWMFDPNSGGKKIPAAVQADVEKRIRAVAEKEFKGKYTRLEIRFKSQFCYSHFGFGVKVNNFSFGFVQGNFIASRLVLSCIAT